MQPELGTKEYTNYLVGQGSKLGMDLSQFTQPTSSADNVVGVSQVNLPNTQPTVPDLSQVKGRVEFNKTVGDYYMAQAESAKAEREKAKDSPLAGLADQSLKRFESLPNIAEIRSQAKSLTGFDDEAVKDYFAKQSAAREELATLTGEYDKLLAQRDQAIEARRQQGGGTTAGTDQAIAQVTRDFNFRLNQQSAVIKTKSALMEARQGNFQEAQTFIKEAVNDATYETRFNLDLFSTFYGRYESQLEKLDSKYNDAVKSALTSAKEAYDTQYEEMTKKGELMIKYPELGITLNESLEDAYGKLATAISSGAIMGGKSTGFKDSKVEEDVRATIYGDGGSIDRISSGASTVEKEYARIRGLYSPKEVTDDAIKELLGIKPVESGETTTGPTSLAEARAEKLEERVAQLQSSGILTASDIRASLRKDGFTPDEINSSSVGGLMDQIVSFLFR